MDTRQLLSDNLTTIAVALKTAIDEDRSSKAKEKARTGKRYYEYQHDILDNRIFYIAPVVFLLGALTEYNGK